jgi:hypothetical protein
MFGSMRVCGVFLIAQILIPNDRALLAICCPIAPNPMIARTFPVNSLPPNNGSFENPKFFSAI